MNRSGQADEAEGGPGCLPEGMLVEFRAGRLADADEERLFAHVAVCPACERRLGGGRSTRLNQVFGVPLPTVGTVRIDTLVRANEERSYLYLDPPLDGHPDDEGSLLKKYRVVAAVGRGGFATVFEGYDQLGRRIAIKVLDRPQDGAGHARLRREAVAGAELGAVRELVHVREAEIEHRPPFITMNFVEGVTLRELLKNTATPGTAIAQGDALRVVLDVARALAALHDKGWVHQDVKPANIIVTPSPRSRSRLGLLLDRVIGPSREAGLRATLIDLGLAFKPLAKMARPRGSTEDYESPEQRKPKGQVGPKSDVYSLGAVIFETLTGGRATGVGEKKRPGKRWARENVPPKIAGLCLDCLSREVDRRPDAARVVKALSSHLGRHRRRVGWGAVSAFALLLAVGVSLYAYERSTRKAEEAQAAEALAAAEEAKGLNADFIRQLETEREKSFREVGRVTAAAREALDAAEKAPSADLVRLADRLREVADGAGVPGDQSREDRIRVASATAALAEGRYEDVLHTLPLADVVRIAKTPGVDPDFALHGWLVRATAFERLRWWDDAVTAYELAVDARPELLYSTLGLARCLFELRKPAEEYRVWSAFIDHARKRAGPDPQPGPAAGELALALVCRMQVAIELGKEERGWVFVEARDVDRIVTAAQGRGDTGLDDLLMTARAVEATLLFEDKNYDAALGACVSILDLMLSHGVIHPVASFGALERAQAVARGALEKLAGAERERCRRLLILVSLNKGFRAIELGGYDLAIGDGDLALRHLAEVPSRVFDDESRSFVAAVAYRLRMLGHKILGTRALMKDDRAAVTEYDGKAMPDADRAIAECEAALKHYASGRYPTKGKVKGEVEWVEEVLALTLFDRAVLHARAGRREPALADVERSIRHLTRLATELGRHDLAKTLARTIELRAEFLTRLGK